MKRTKIWILFLGFLGLQAPLWAAPGVPMQITYQGTLKQSGVPAPTALYPITFAIVDANGNILVNNGDLHTPANVPVANGLFAVQLTIPSTVDWQNVTPYIQISIGGQVLSPAQAINSNMYSIVSQTVVDHAITNSKLAVSVANELVPTGAITAFAGAAAPTGWIICDGSAVSRTIYAALFAVIGTTWGAGDESSTFNLPDLRGRAPIGAGQGTNLSNRSVGNTLGEETHTLAVTEMPAHSHTIIDPGHHHESATGGVGPFGTGPVRANCEGATGLYTVSTALTSTVTTGITVASTGSSAAHNIMQPSAVVNFVIKL